MYVFRTIRGLQQFLKDLSGRSVGFVPTMGALHDGHLSLLRRSRQETDLTIVSIFVNPSQFNDPKDLEVYPRQTGRDVHILYSEGCDVVFIPSELEIYPPGEEETPISLAGLDEMMEGKFRPGHFQGVAQVVKRLLNIVSPDALFMGQKDFQQVAVIRHVIHTSGIPVRLVMCPTIREADGLAMSSRNMLLDQQIRQEAPVIFRTLKFAADAFPHTDPRILEQECLHRLTIPGFVPEYFEIVDGHTLRPSDPESKYVVACCAVRAGNVRLIDNLVLKEEE